MKKNYLRLKILVIGYLISGTLFVHFFKPMGFGSKLLIFSFVNFVLYLVGVGLRNKDFVTGKRVHTVLMLTFSIYAMSYSAYTNREGFVLRSIENRINDSIYLQNEEDWKNLKVIVEKDNTAHKFYDISYITDTYVFSFYNGEDLLFSYPTRRESGFGIYRSISIFPESSPSGITGVFFSRRISSAEREDEFLMIPVIYR